MVAVARAAYQPHMSEAAVPTHFGDFYQCLGLFKASELLSFYILHQFLEQSSLMNICLHPDSQGQGYGTRLLRHAISKMQSSEAEVILLEVRASNSRAISLYQKLGFEISGVRAGFYRTQEGTEDAVMMRRLLGHAVSIK
jgi:ribosomal-protein-alanine N-acetyltransferase